MENYEETDDKNYVGSQRINMRLILRCSSCSGGLHLWVDPKLIEKFQLERGDKLTVKIEEVQYCNLRELKK